MRRATIIWILAAYLAAPAARAQSGDKATAEILFNDGRRLMQEGKLEAACDKLAESQRLDPAVGTLLNLADCREKQGRSATAWATWLEAAAGARSAGQTDRENLARQRAEALKPRLVTLTIDVPQANRLPGLTVSRNGTSLGPTLWGTAAPVDPGTHTITASAPGYATWSTDVVVREGSPSSVIVPQLTAQPVSTTPPSSAVAPPSEPGSVPPTATEHRSGPPVATYIAGGVGIVGLGIGTIFGLQAKSKNDDSKEFCSTNTRCSEDGVSLRDDAFQAATISTVGFVVGGIGLATAAVFWITAPKEVSTHSGAGIRGVTAVALPGAAAFSVRGAF